MAAWVETSRGKDAGESRTSTVWVKDLHDAGGAPRRITEATGSAYGLAWSPDGRLAFISTADSSEQVQLYICDKPGSSKPKKITSLQGYLADPQWSPDGRRIALLYIEGAT